MVSTEKLLALLHLCGGIAMFALAFQKEFWPFFIVMLVYQLAYMPTMSLTNAICFHHISNAQTEFGKLRLWGTIGWIAASWPFVFILAGKTGPDLHAALSQHLHRGRHRLDRARRVLTDAAAHASGTARGRRQRADESDRTLEGSDDARPLHRDDDGCAGAPVLLPVDQPVPATGGACRELDHAGDERRADRGDRVDGRAGLGAGELGWRWTMTIGILAHAARFFVFAIGDPLWLMVAINIVHGMCYAFFFAAVYIFVDERCPRDARASAQGLFNLVILGIGPFAGSLLWGWLGDVFSTANGAVDFPRLFLAPAVLALAAALLMAVAFRPRATRVT